MDIALVAKLLGGYLMISGLFLIFRGKTVPHLLNDFFGHPAVVYLTGIILVFLSGLMLLQNNVWDGSVNTIVTVLSWLVFIKGLAYIFAPKALHKMVTNGMLKALNLYGLVAFLAGLSLYYLS